MQKKNKALTLTLVLLLLVMVTLGTLGGTFAKYTSSATGTDSARVAKWSFTVSDKDIAQENTFTIDLFETAYTNVESKDQTNVIAPGTEGEFTLSLTNNSEVTAEYTIDFDVVKTAAIPIEFSVDGSEWADDLTDALTATEIGMGVTKDVKIQWRWADVEANNASDTTLGKVGTDTVTVKATVVASQKVA